MNPFFSIIMPAYNVKKYIDEAVMSIKNQSFADFECIIVDDGSTDGGVEAVANLIKDDTRFSVIKQKNGGLSNARNNGFKAARGQYVLFLDSDDLFELDLLEAIHTKLQESPVDIVVFNHTVLDDITGHKSSIVHDFAPVRDKKQFTAKQISDKAFNIFGNQVWTKAFRRDLLVENALVFDEKLKRAEDIPFTNPALLLAKSIAVVDEGLVAYRVNRGDSNSDRLAAYYKDIFVSLGKVYDTLIALKVLDVFHKSFQNLFMENMYYNLNALVGTDAFKDEFKLAKRYAKEYKVTAKADDYLHEQLYSVSTIILTQEPFDMLTYIITNDKRTLTEKQTALYAKDDVIAHKDREVAESKRQYDELLLQYQTLNARHAKLVGNPVIKGLLVLRRSVRKIIDGK